MARSNYVYGYDHSEFSRLQEQHRIWLPWIREHWAAAALRGDDVVLDLGCGPGFASTELARQGIRVLAIDQDQKSLDILNARCREQRIAEVRVYPACDVMELPPFDVTPTVVYTRWLLCYLGAMKTEVLLNNLSLSAGSRVVTHDFINYRSARLEPFSSAVQLAIDGFARRMADPDIGFVLPAILRRCGFDVTWKRVVALAIAPTDPEWAWPDDFFNLHVPSLENANMFFADWKAAAFNPAALFYTWPVLQIVAVKK